MTAKIEPESYPAEALPDTVRAAVMEVAGFVQAPLPLIAASALAALSLACQAHIDVRRAEKLQSPSGLFLLTIADSGERKSTCDGFFMPAIRQYQDEQAEIMKPAIREYQAALAGWNAEDALHQSGTAGGEVMTLSTMIQKNRFGKFANANPANFANAGQANGRTLAELATLALANPEKAKTDTSNISKISNFSISKLAETQTEAETFLRFLLHYPGGEVRETACTPAMTITEARAAFPDALEVEPDRLPGIQQPETTAATVKDSLTAGELEAVRAWLASIGETDEGIIAEALGACAINPEVKAYYIGRADEARQAQIRAHEAELLWYPCIENPATGYLGMSGNNLKCAG